MTPDVPRSYESPSSSRRLTLSGKGSICSLGEWSPLFVLSRLYSTFCKREAPPWARCFFLPTGATSQLRQRFVNLVRDALRKARIDQSKYCGHSFRIGAATTAAAKGMEDCIIKTLGRWESLAYLQYVRLPREQLAGYSSLLVS